ncbi:amino acid adenylation domain-containing protein [Pseudomonas sp. NPDC090202]|uniref:non-ribosomal peptide synthetase n=1 Tax=unclassified Pseudomonas TaxID=196821 RepID=UPI003809B2B5
MSTIMNSAEQNSVDIGQALLAEQQQHLSAIEQGARRADVSHGLRLEIRGPLQVARLQQALDSLASRHPLLTSGFVSVPGYHGLRQVQGAAARAVELTVHDEIADATVVELRADAWQQQPASLADAGLQALLQRCTAEHWQLRLSLAAHLGDVGSLKLLAEELRAAYANGPLALDEDAGQFSQYLDWRSEVLFDEDAETARQYWQQHVLVDGAVPAAPEMPYRLTQVASGEATALRVDLSAGVSAALVALAEQRGISVDRLLQGAWWALLARISGREVFAVGWRHDARRDYEFFAESAGLFEKTLPLVLHVATDQAFGQWLNGLNDSLEQHATWQEYWSAQAYPELASPAYGFALRQALTVEEGTGLLWSAQGVSQGRAAFELLLEVEQATDGAVQALNLQYDAGRYSVQAAQALLEQYQTLLQHLPRQIDLPIAELDLLSESALARLLAFNPTGELADSPLLPQRIADWARRTPDALALVDGAQSLNYAELDLRAAQLAAQLAQSGVAAGSIVGLALPRSAALIVAMLASWKVGAAYVPLDPQWPPARQAQVLEQAGAVLLLADDHALPEGFGEAIQVLGVEQAIADGAALPALTPFASQGRDVAYLLFTSGSTGVPKGVVIEQRHLLNYTAGVSQTLALQDCRHFALSSTVAADLGNTTLFGALFNGAALHVADEATMQDPQAFAAFVREQSIDCLKIVPSHLAALLDSPNAALPNTVILGGEAPAPSLIQRLREVNRQSRVFNHYGPTETTVGVLVHEITTEQAHGVPLTQVLPGNEVYVLNERLQLVAPGELGELYIGGRQVCRGYLNAGREAFVDSPFQADERLYRTGDLARYRLQGGVQLQGRRDDQVKIRGFRIELAEIEAQLAALTDISEAVVVLNESAEVQGFVVARQGALVSAQELKAELALRLPAVMQPRSIQVLPAMPRLPNGKADRKALRGYQVAAPLQDYVAPRDALEELLATRMAQLLGIERLSVTQDFFAAGGHSLLVIKLVAGIRKLLQCDIHPGVVFDHPSPAALAQVLRAQEGTAGQLEKLANARLRLDAMTPEQKAALLEKARAQN